MQVSVFNDLVSRLHSGGPESWGALLSALSPSVVGYLERMGIDHHLAEDVSQEVLVTVYRKLDGLRDPTAFVGWVRMIARNRLRSRLRRTRYTEVLDDDGAVTGRDALDAVYIADLRRVVSEEVDRFRGVTRRVLELRILEDRSHTEVATSLNLSAAQLRKKLYVAIKRLRARLRTRLAEPPSFARHQTNSH